MTGYGRARWGDSHASIDVEVRTVNNRYLKLHLHIPDGLAPYQHRLERHVRSELARGTLSMTIRCLDSERAPGNLIDDHALAYYLTQLRSSGEKLHVTGLGSLAELLDLPGIVVEAPPEPLAEKLVTRLFEVVTQALTELVATRVAEGVHLEASLRARLCAMNEALSAVRVRALAIPGEIQEKLRERVRVLLGETAAGTVDGPALAREVALLADRADVTEELDRLDAHLHRFEVILAAPRPEPEGCGRELEFFAQEMLREANTIASKSVDREVTHLVVGIKSEVEKIKEQLQNVE